MSRRKARNFSLMCILGVFLSVVTLAGQRDREGPIENPPAFSATSNTTTASKESRFESPAEKLKTRDLSPPVLDDVNLVPEKLMTESLPPTTAVVELVPEKLKTTISLPPSAKKSLVKLVSVFETGTFNSYTRFNQRLIAYLADTDHIFVLTTKVCAFENLPSAWQYKCSCVNVERFDEAYYQPNNYVGSHHARISNSHRTFVEIARTMQWGSVGVIEGDITSFRAAGLNKVDLKKFKSLLLSDKWDMIRFGYRPFFLEGDPTALPKQCPNECVCSLSLGGESMGGHGCVVTSGACDMRSSDAYILNSNSFTDFETLLDKFTVDMEPMQRLPRIWFATPQLAFQVDSAQSIETQTHWAQTFVERCVRA